MIKAEALGFEPILSNIDFSLDAGKTLAVVGHNGAGKTTLFHLLLNFKFQTSGSCSITEKKVGYVPERPYLDMEETLHSLLNLHLKLLRYQGDSEQEIRRVSGQVGLEGQLGEKLKNFSKGMLQKALLAQAMLGSPRLMFLDEPMSGLDAESRGEWLKYFLELKKSGVTIVFSSHVMEDVRALADQILVLDHGKQEYSGPATGWSVK